MEILVKISKVRNMPNLFETVYFQLLFGQIEENKTVLLITYSTVEVLNGLSDIILCINILFS